MNNTNDGGVTTTFEKGWTNWLIGVAIAMVGAGILFIMAKIWLAGVYKDIGPDRSADVTMIAALMGVCGGVLALLFVGVVAFFWTRVSKHTVAPNYYQLPVDQTPLLGTPKGARQTPLLPAGNMYRPSAIDRRPRVKLKVRGQVIPVPREAMIEALKMPRLHRDDARFGHEAFTTIRAYLIEQRCVDSSGKFDEEMRARIYDDLIKLPVV